MNARTMLSIGLMAVVLPAFGQQAPILKEGQVTEDALVDALTPAQPIRTRSIRVMRDDEAGGGRESGGAAPKPASASLLITFETNSAALTARAKRSLDVVGDALASDKLASFRFGIEGYADPRGVSAVNLKLSQARAESVRDYLVSSKHIDRARLEPVGKGDQDLLNKSNPIAPENRRVTIVNLSK
jgi:outer membrane protein OmpA-like peptidoglycan-associated protein